MSFPARNNNHYRQDKADKESSPRLGQAGTHRKVSVWEDANGGLLVDASSISELTRVKEICILSLGRKWRVDLERAPFVCCFLINFGSKIRMSKSHILG
jgi:hypothetical protein